MKKYIIPIKGMHCCSCEILIEMELSKIRGSRNVKANFKQKKALFEFEGNVKHDEIYSAVKRIGYEVGEDGASPWLSKNKRDYKELATASAILFVLYLIIKNIGVLNLGSSFGSPSSLGVVFLIGLTAGISTCMALVGGLILGVTARHTEKHPYATPIQKFRPHIFFNLGRIASYTLLGGVIALIGSAFQLSSSFLGYLTISVGIVMIILGLKLIEIFPRLSKGNFTLPAGVSKLLGIQKHQEKEYSHKNAFILGVFTFFLPCGFTQAMQLYAMTTGSFISGALIMGAFALGTTPGLLSVGVISSAVKGAFARKFFRFVGITVIALSLSNISNGLNLAGYPIKIFSPKKSVQTSTNPEVYIINGIQIVKMTANSSGYSPNNFTIKAGIPVKWIIIAEEENSCANFLLSQKLGIKNSLKKGENVFEFTPKEEGTISFMCAMGMYTGVFNVVGDDGSSQGSDSKTKIGPELPTIE